MLNYAYRWVYVGLWSVCLLLMGVVLILEPQRATLSRLKISKQELKERVRKIENLIPHPRLALHTPMTNADLLAELLGEIHHQGLTVNAIHLLEPMGLEIKPIQIKVTLTGQWSSILRLVVDRSTPSYWLALTQFTLLPQPRDQLRLNATLSIRQLSAGDRPALTLPSTFHNAFCGTQISTVFDASTLPVSSASLHHLNMTGYVKFGSHYLALLALPNNTLLAVEEGMQLNQDSRIKIITPTYTDILLPNQQTERLLLK